MGNHDKNTKLLFLDEGMMIMQQQVNEDNLTEDLRKIPGVPKTTYLIQDNLVFVFAALREKVTALRKAVKGDTLKDIVVQAMPFAWMSPEEAVNKWHIVPVPYKLIEEDGNLLIIHEPFCATIPTRFRTDVERNTALAALLMGKIVPGQGDFEFQGQPMTLRIPIGLEQLPPSPILDIDSLGPADSDRYSHLQSVAFKEGFQPLTRNLFVNIKALEADWTETNTRMIAHTNKHWEAMWGNLSHINLESLNEDDAVPNYGLENMQELRSLYPELTALSDGTLYCLYDTYQNEYFYISGWTPSRDNAFLCYILGVLAVGRGPSANTIADAGQFVAYEILRGESSENAFAAGVTWMKYDNALGSLAFRMAQITRFLCQYGATRITKGPPVGTMMDLFRMGRKYKPQVISVTQAKDDLFSGGTA